MKYTTKILLESKNNRDGEFRLRFRVRWEGNVAQFFIKYTVNPDKWSKETNRCKNGTSHGKFKISAAEINREISLYEDSAEKAFLEFDTRRKSPTVEEFKDKFLELIGKQPKKQEKSFFDVFDDFVNEQSSLNSWTKATHTKFGAIKKHLQAFDSKLSFDEMDEMKLNSFIHYQQSRDAMRLTYENSETGLRNSTILKNLAFVKWFLRWASNKGYYSGKLHDNFKPKLKTVENKVVIYLTWQELMHLYSFDFYSYKNDDGEHLNPEKAKALDRVRDVFCFSCFTSLRYSDVEKLKKNDIKETYIFVVTKKTNDTVKIELNNYSSSILKKYSDMESDKALPVISNYQMNQQLKEVGRIVGLDEIIRIVYFVGSTRYEETYPKHELLTTHCGRRTFIVNALYLGIPAEVVMSWTGHADYESMKPYIAIVDELKRDSMDKFNK